MSISVGTTVTLSAPGKPRDGMAGSVLELRGEHARCQFADGSSAWVPLVSLTAAGSLSAGLAVAASQPSFRAVAPGVAPGASPGGAQGGSEPPLEWGWIALIYLGLTVVPTGCTLIGAIVYSIPYYVWRKERPGRAQQWQKHVWIAFGFGFAIWGSLGLLAHFLQKSDAKAGTDAAGLVPHTVDSGKLWNSAACELRVPSDWLRKDPPRSPSASLELDSPNDEFVAIIVSEPLDDFDPKLSLEGYVKLAVEGSPLQTALVEHTNLVLNATPAQRQVRTGLADSVKMTLLNTYLRTSKQFHQIIIAAPTRKFNEQRPTFEQIAASVRCDDARGNR